MNCNVIMDLMPLYVDECCSTESSELVREHLKHCTLCQIRKQEMETDLDETIQVQAVQPLKRIRLWRASLLQAVQQFLSFSALVAAVSLEAATVEGNRNGFWAVLLLVPFTAFLLSQTNWYFVRSYGRARAFCIGSAVACLGFGLFGYGWALLHYGTVSIHRSLPISVALTLVLSIVSFASSSVYAAMLGKE